MRNGIQKSGKRKTPLKALEEEFEMVDRILPRGFDAKRSRWLEGYRDGLLKALQIIKGEEK